MFPTNGRGARRSHLHKEKRTQEAPRAVSVQGLRGGVRSAAFCATWDCISSSSSSPPRCQGEACGDAMPTAGKSAPPWSRCTTVVAARAARTEGSRHPARLGDAFLVARIHRLMGTRSVGQSELLEAVGPLEEAPPRACGSSPRLGGTGVALRSPGVSRGKARIFRRHHSSTCSRMSGYPSGRQ